jgi:hypothetical protein
MGTAGGVLGMVGARLSLVPLFGIVFGLILGALAVVFGSIDLGRASSAGGRKGLATTGLVLGVVTIVFKLISGINLLGAQVS